MMGLRAQRRLGLLITYLLLVLGMCIVITPFWYMVTTSFKPQTTIFKMPPEFWQEP